MGAIGVVDWDKIWKVYETPKDLQRNARKTVRGRWYDYLKDSGRQKEFSWYCLSEREQDEFIYRIIYDTMINRYVSSEAEKKVRRKVQKFIANSMMGADDHIQASNDAINNLYRDHDTNSHSEAEKRKAYNELCRDIQNFKANIPLPTYKEFERRLLINNAAVRSEKAEDKKKANRRPITAYNYVGAYENTTPNPTLQVDDAIEVYVRIILKVLEEKMGLKVDYNLIDDCLLCKAEFWEYLRWKGIDLDDWIAPTIKDEKSGDGECSIEWEKFPIEYDENMGISREEFEELKMNYAAYLSCQKKLDALSPLYKYEK